MNMKAYYQARSKQLSLEIDEILSHISQDMLRGRHAEELLKKYLQTVLPEKYGVDTGLVTGIDAGGRFVTSREVDIIVYDKHENPALQTLGGFKIFPAESVSAVVAVKITATTDTILTGTTNGFENISSVKEIPRNKFLIKSILPGVSGGGNPDDIIHCIFTYKSGVGLSTLAKNISQKYTDQGNSFTNFPDIVCVLDAGNIIVNPAKHEFNVNGEAITRPFFIPENEALMIFTCSLISMLSRQVIMPVDIFQYANALSE